MNDSNTVSEWFRKLDEHLFSSVEDQATLKGWIDPNRVTHGVVLLTDTVDGKFISGDRKKRFEALIRYARTRVSLICRHGGLFPERRRDLLGCWLQQQAGSVYVSSAVKCSLGLIWETAHLMKKAGLDYCVCVVLVPGEIRQELRGEKIGIVGQAVSDAEKILKATQIQKTQLLMPWKTASVNLRYHDLWKHGIVDLGEGRSCEVAGYSPKPDVLRSGRIPSNDKHQP